VHPKFHVSKLRQFESDAIGERATGTPVAIQLKDGEEWEVEEILDKRKKGKGVQYLVSWKGFGPQENSWEPEANLKNCQELRETFNQQFPNVASKHRRRWQKK
jgi:hypothetical protein